MNTRYIRSEASVIADAYRKGTLHIPEPMMTNLRKAMLCCDSDVLRVYAGVLRFAGSRALMEDCTKEDLFELLSKAFYALICIAQEKDLKEFEEWMNMPVYQKGEPRASE